MDLLFFEEDYAEYIEVLNEKLLETNEGNCERTISLLLNRGHAEMKLGLARKAISSAEKVLSLNSLSLKAYLLKAKAWRLLGNSSEITIALKEGEKLVRTAQMEWVTDSHVIEEFKELLSLTKQDSRSAVKPHSATVVESLPQEVLLSPPLPPAATSASQIKRPQNRKPPPPYNVGETIETREDPAGEDETIDFDFTQDEFNDKRKSVSRNMLQSVFEGLMRNFGQPVDTDILVQARGSLAHASGDDLVDSLIALGYLQVNTGNLEMACEIFQLLLGYELSLTACHMGIGSVRAMQRKYGAAIISFDAAIDLCPDSFDAWKRRGQTKAAMGHPKDGLADLKKSKQLFLEYGDELHSQHSNYAMEETADIAYQLGLVYHQLKDFRMALTQFMEARRCGLTNPPILNFLGMCEGQLGHVDASLAFHKECLEIAPAFKECILNLAQMFKEQGNFRESEALFTEAINMYLSEKETCGRASFSQSQDDGANICDPSSTRNREESLGLAYRYRAQLNYGSGNRRAALRDFEAGLEYMSQAHRTESSQAAELEARLLYGIALQAVGDFQHSIEAFECVIKEDESSYAFFLREIAIYMANLMHEPLGFYRLSPSSPDAAVPPEIKLGSCKKLSRGMLLIESGMDIKKSDSRVALARLRQQVGGKETLSREVAARLIRAVSTVGKVVFLDSPGFLHNTVQARQFGLAVLCTSASLRHEVDLCKKNGKGPSADAGAAWRQIIDRAVRWRQLSEPMDPVWWIDGMPSRDFTEGFGLQTPIINGQLSTVRYSCYFDQAFHTMKRIMLEKGYYDAIGEQLLTSSTLSELKREEVRKATTLDDLHSAVGLDFFVIVPCVLSNSRDTDATAGPEEGTRLTLIKDSNPPGFQFTIRTPSTPERWKAFDEEMRAQVQLTITAIYDSMDYGVEKSPEPVLKAALSFFYYWVIFSPLSRGSAATGYVILHSILAAAGFAVSESAGSGLPQGKQLDWEAILAPNKQAYLDLALSWYLPIVQKAPFITETPLESSACSCCQTSKEGDLWDAWGSNHSQSKEDPGRNDGVRGSWRWEYLHARDLQQVKTAFDMMYLLNFSE